MDAIITDNISKISDQGVVATLLVLVIAALIWDRTRILNAHKEMTDGFIAAIKENGDKYAQVVTDNTKAYSDLAAAIRDRSK